VVTWQGRALAGATTLTTEERVPFGALSFFIYFLEDILNVTQLALFTIGTTRIWYKGKVRLVTYCIDWRGHFEVLQVEHE
jgi:hypothetical protein